MAKLNKQKTPNIGEDTEQRTQFLNCCWNVKLRLSIAKVLMKLNIGYLSAHENTAIILLVNYPKALKT